MTCEHEWSSVRRGRIECLKGCGATMDAGPYYRPRLEFEFSSRDLENIEKLKEQGFVFDRVVMVDREGRERYMSICVPSPASGRNEAMTIDEAQELYGFLRGGTPPKGFTINARPRLSANAAFSVLYVLQERYRLIPDTFEQCDGCKELFDSENGSCGCGSQSDAEAKP